MGPNPGDPKLDVMCSCGHTRKMHVNLYSVCDHTAQCGCKEFDGPIADDVTRRKKREEPSFPPGY